MTDTFTPPGPLQTAVLFLVFNRPDTTAQVFEAIRRAQPPRLYVAADGPRADRAGEAEKVAKVREIATAADWPCEVKTLFREENLGCKSAVSKGITWFFEHEEQGIILEDDCLPSQSFFWFCEELLAKYSDDDRVGQISGFNALGNYSRGGRSYHFSNFGSIWGWASWRRAWSCYDVDIKNFPDVKRYSLLKAVIVNRQEYEQRMKDFESTFDKKIDTWDYQWIFARLLNRFLIIIPHTSLIKNIGFGECATHTKNAESPLSYIENVNIKLPLDHPNDYLPDVNFEAMVHSNKRVQMSKKIMLKIKKEIIKWVKK